MPPYCKLALDRTSISDIEMRKVISYLKMHPEITDVDLMFTKVSNKALAALISEVRPLHDIDAFNPGYSLGKENKEDLDILAQVIEKSEHLAELSLPSMDAVGLSMMTNYLKKNQTIQSISLSISHQDEKKANTSSSCDFKPT